MFSLVAVLFIVTNGVMAEQPSGHFKNKMQFKTEQSCQEYLNSEQGQSSRLFIETLIDEQKGRLAAKFICVQVGGGFKEDDAI